MCLEFETLNALIKNYYLNFDVRTYVSEYNDNIINILPIASRT